MWSLVQAAKMRLVGCWVSKLATKANVHSVWVEAMMTAARYKPDSSSDKTPANNTCQHPSLFCRQHLPPTVVVRGRHDCPANTVCANREITTEDYSGTTLYKHGDRHMHHQGQWVFGRRLLANITKATLHFVGIFWSVQEVQVVCSTKINADNERQRQNCCDKV